MKVVLQPDRSLWPALLQRPVFEIASLQQTIEAILSNVQQQGDAALKAYTLQFDRVAIDQLEVQPDEFAFAEQTLPGNLKKAILQAKENIRKFHASQQEAPQRITTMPGVTCWRKSVPIDRVGFYVPGGTAPLFSSVLMMGVPAEIAACPGRILCTPPRKDGTVHPAILYSAQVVGIKRVFKVGGSQAIAAMAYGTETIPAVYKIFGPGNQYVDAAKQFVSRQGIAIDLPAGPSEVLVYADASTPAAFVAADLLAQAEHGVDSQVVFLTTSETYLREVQKTIQQQVSTLPRQDIAREALSHSLGILLQDERQIVDFINEYAPEHLILANENAAITAERIRNAGSVFLGPYTPESVGDYASGTNHTLPTNGFARAYGGLSLDDFVKKITFQELTPQGLQTIGSTVEIMAEFEELEAHKRAVTLRLDALRNQINPL